ncbi:caspase-1-like isoform X2 [Bacillus rossius redtenbacheri]
MAHARRGVALVLNHERVGGMEQRKGTAKDCQDLVRALEGLGFEVDVRQDLSCLGVKACLRAVAALDHSDADCLVVAAMTHGDPDLLFASDGAYPVKDLWQPFTADKCPSLAAKPKLFFVQACRGKKVDDGVRVTQTLERDSIDGSLTSYTIPIQADILVAYSTVEGYYSWRNPRNGSWFIQSLCKELRVNGASHHLLTLLTFVCRRVAVDYQSAVPFNYEMDLKKQVPTITSTLTRLVYFPSKKGHAG